MYSNKYYIQMRILGKTSKEYDLTERKKLETTRIEHNELFAAMNDKNTVNRKYISEIDIDKNGYLGFHLETEKPLDNPLRYGNALRFFSVLVCQNGLDVYVKNNKFMKAA